MLSGSDLRRLLELRRRIRADVLALLPGRRHQFYVQLVDVRRTHLPGPRDPARSVMTPAEVLREIKWMVNTLSLPEAEAAVRVLDRLQRTPARGRPATPRSAP